MILEEGNMNIPLQIDISVFQDPQITVNITNVLKSHNQLIVHYKSGNDDLRIH